MSYDLYLLDPVTRKVLHAETPHQLRGGTYALGGTTELCLNCTYNYSDIFERVLGVDKGIRVLYGRTGAETIPVLQQAIAHLGDDATDNYWDATEGNVKRALCGLLALARLRPDGVWDGD